jgi:hypothetical protein
MKKIPQEAIDGILYLCWAFAMALAFVVLLGFYEWRYGAGSIAAWLNGS